jgi:hypothetical protein
LGRTPVYALPAKAGDEPERAICAAVQPGLYPTPGKTVVIYNFQLRKVGDRCPYVGAFVAPLSQFSGDTRAGLFGAGYHAQGGAFRTETVRGKAETGFFLGADFLAGEKIIPTLERMGKINGIEGKQGTVRKTDTENSRAGLYSG